MLESFWTKPSTRSVSSLRKIVASIRLMILVDMRLLLLMTSIFLFDVSSTFSSKDMYSGNETMKSFSALTPRKKRSLTFPKGSNFVLTITFLKAIQVRVPTNWNLDLEFDMIWPIPEGVNRGKPSLIQRPFQLHRRHRRELYANLELALDSQGLPGNQCILRTICEAKSILNPPGVSLVEDIIRVVFSYPQSTIFKNDDYDNAYFTKKDCDIVYPCPFSLLDFLLNYNDHLSNY